MKFLMNPLEDKLIYLKELSKISNINYNKKIMRVKNWFKTLRQKLKLLKAKIIKRLFKLKYKNYKVKKQKKILRLVQRKRFRLKVINKLNQMR